MVLGLWGVLYDTAIVTTLPGLDGDLEMFLVYDVDIQQLMDVCWNDWLILFAKNIFFLFLFSQLNNSSQTLQAAPHRHQAGCGCSLMTSNTGLTEGRELGPRHSVFSNVTGELGGGGRIS